MTSERPLPAPLPPAPPLALEQLLQRAGAYAEASLAPATRKSYGHDFATFASWCAEHGCQPLPAAPAAVAAFLAAEADREYRPVTIARRAAAIAWAHRAHDQPNPCDSAAVAQVLAGIRRQDRTGPARKAAPLELDPLERLLTPIDASTLAGLRDRALLLLGFAAALRRSELVALDTSDLEFDAANGLLLTIRKSKTDQEQQGAKVAVPYAHTSERCAVHALRQWLETADIHQGPVFRRMHRGDTIAQTRLSDQSVALIVKRRAKAAGLPPTLLSGHSLRSGYATSAARAGIEERKIANVTRHKNLPTLRGYIRTATAFDDVGEVL